ncbi:hypothetical protein HY218_00520 [Candidatus Saccharibacteria bacterium]|nr:hypothetical protein [Candidatus Saccharibacteria bacterium]
MKSTTGRRGRLMLSVLFLGLVLTSWFYRWPLYDWLQLRNYTPNPAIILVADQTSMKVQARHFFYLNHPQIQPNPAFSASCPNNGGEQTIVLGCYQSHETGIFLYKVTDAKLNGVIQVTAAHETLHAIYERLSSRDKKYVNGLLEDYFEHQLHDNRILKTLAAYKKSEPNDVLNEMHSIFGTEVVDLPPALENYYQRYFTNRKQIAAYAQHYQNAFVSRQDQVMADDAKLKVLKQRIESLERSLQSQYETLTGDKKHLDTLLASNQVAAYNSAVPSYNQAVNTYNRDVATARQLIDEYNKLVKERNDVALEENELVKAIDSRPNTIMNE